MENETETVNEQLEANAGETQSVSEEPKQFDFSALEKTMQQMGDTIAALSKKLDGMQTSASQQIRMGAQFNDGKGNVQAPKRETEYVPLREMKFFD